MAFWGRWFKVPSQLSELDDALAQRDAIYQIGRENTQWVMDALVKQRDEARAALASREAEVGRLVSVLRQIEWISDYDKDAVCPMCNHEGKHDTDCELADALADHTP